MPTLQAGDNYRTIREHYECRETRAKAHHRSPGTGHVDEFSLCSYAPGLRLAEELLSLQPLSGDRGVAQSGRVPALGAGCRWFESSHPDHFRAAGSWGSSWRRAQQKRSDADHAGANFPAFQDGHAVRTRGRAALVARVRALGAARSRSPDGWTGSADTNSQLRIYFDSEAEAIAYARKNGYAYRIVEPNERVVRPKAYSDNFRYDRISPWTH